MAKSSIMLKEWAILNERIQQEPEAFGISTEKDVVHILLS